MKTTEFDGDAMLNSFLCDYLDGELSEGESASFEEYLHQNDAERAFAAKARKGMKALQRLRNAHLEDIESDPVV